MHSYPKVFAIGHRAIADLFKGPVTVEEKVDGSQFSFQVNSDGLDIRSRGATIHVDAPEKMFAKGVDSIVNLAPYLREGWTYRVEYLQKPKHNVLAYDRVPNGNIILFDIDMDDECYLTRNEKEIEAARLGLEIVPLMADNIKVTSPEQLLEFLTRTSILGGAIEGIVVKNYKQFGEDKKVLMGKFVREEFKETHNKEWKANNPSIGDVVDRIIATLRSEVRWQKAVNRLRDAGQLEHSPRDIGKLIKEIQHDVSAEETDFIQKKLYEYAAPHIIRASSAGAPEWYKEQLLRSAFDGN